MTTRRDVLVAHLLLLGVVIIWGCSFSIVKAALTDASPLLFNFVRMTLAFLLLAAINVKRLKSVTRRELTLCALVGVLLAAGYQFQTAGLTSTTAAKSAFITGLVVVIVPLLAAVPGVSGPAHRKPSTDSYLGALAAFAGLILLTTPPNSGTALLSGFGMGELLSLLCAIAFAAHLLALARAAPQVSALRLGTLQIGFAALTMLCTLPLERHPFLHATPRFWLAVAVTAVLGTAAAFTIQSWAQQHLPPSNIALIVTLEPVFAWLTALFFFREHLGRRGLLGAGLILAGILIAELQPTRRSQHAAAIPA